MTVWILHQPLTPDDEMRIQHRLSLTLPYDGWPDLSAIHSHGACRRLLQSLDPGIPPETLAVKSDYLWQRYGELKKDDIIAVPLPSRKTVALAGVTDVYRFDPHASPRDAHQVMINWYSRRINFFSLRPYRALLEQGTGMMEVTDVELRTKLREKLPYRYNRFSKWKWLVAAFTAMNLIAMLASLAHSGP